MKRNGKQIQGARLYLVGTPIGNYDDMTFRAIDTLKKVKYIYCEDTRVTSQLLFHFDIHTPLRSYNVVTENELTDGLLDLVLSGNDIAIVSDAGMPGISDPGFLACKNAWDKGINVEVIPGVSASLMAIVASGIPCRNFYFVGFLNSKQSKRIEELNSLKRFKSTMIIYEAPHRISECLKDIDMVFGTRQIVVARELTKKYEEHLKGTAKEILDVVQTIKGEIVIIIEGATEEEVKSEINKLSLPKHFEYYTDLGYDKKDALKKVANDLNCSKSEIYSKLFGKDKI